MFYLYILRCADGSLYTGITTDVERRFKEHKNRVRVGAKYTKTHIPQKIEFQLAVGSRSEASKLEYKVKHLTKLQKEQLLCNNISEKVQLVEFLEKFGEM